MNKKENLKNILIVSLDEKFAKNVANSLSDVLDMYFADCKELIIYDLINPKEVIQKCGLDYFKKREKGVISNCASYENTVIAINYDLFKEYSELFMDSLIIYLELPKLGLKETPNKLAYQSRDEFLKGNSDIMLSFNRKTILSATKQIIDRLGDELWILLTKH